MIGELPQDIYKQDETLGPPPRWFNRKLWRWPGMMSTSYPFHFFSGLGGSDLVKKLTSNPELPRGVPAVAARYTSIDPVSPLFRKDLSKYGFGGTSMPSRTILVVSAVILVSAFFLFNRA